MKVELSFDQKAVIDSWLDYGAEIACINLDKVEDALLEREIKTDSDILSMIRDIRILRHELEAFRKPISMEEKVQEVIKEEDDEGGI